MARIDLIKDVTTESLIDIEFHFTNPNPNRGDDDWRSCGTPHGVGVAEQYTITAPFVGFDCNFSESLNTFTDFTIQLNECPVHQNLHVNKLVNTGGPIFLRRIDPSFTSDVYDVGQDSTYTLNTPLFYDQYTNDEEVYTSSITWRIELHNVSRSVPDHVYISHDMKLVIDPRLATVPSHQYIRVIANVAGYFEVNQIIEVNIYEFDDTIGVNNCMHISPITGGPGFNPASGLFVPETEAVL